MTEKIYSHKSTGWWQNNWEKKRRGIHFLHDLFYSTFISFGFCLRAVFPHPLLLIFSYNLTVSSSWLSTHKKKRTKKNPKSFAMKWEKKEKKNYVKFIRWNGGASQMENFTNKNSSTWQMKCLFGINSISPLFFFLFLSLYLHFSTNWN